MSSIAVLAGTPEFPSIIAEAVDILKSMQFLSRSGDDEWDDEWDDDEGQEEQEADMPEPCLDKPGLPPHSVDWVVNAMEWNYNSRHNTDADLPAVVLNPTE